jgi:hypothetical protein
MFVLMLVDLITKDESHRMMKVSKSSEKLMNAMKEAAGKFVCDSVGLNNYVDTLTDEYKDKPVDKCPTGYVLKLDGQKLNVWLHKKQSGYVYGSYNEVVLVRYYMVAQVDEVDKEIVVEAESTLAPVQVIKSTPTSENSSPRIKKPVVPNEVNNAYQNMMTTLAKVINERTIRRENVEKCPVDLTDITQSTFIKRVVADVEGRSCSIDKLKTDEPLSETEYISLKNNIRTKCQSINGGIQVLRSVNKREYKENPLFHPGY